VVATVEVFEHGNEEGEGFATSSFGGAKNVAAGKGERNGAGLDVGESGEVGGFETRESRFGEREVVEAGVGGIFEVLRILEEPITEGEHRYHTRSSTAF
jgi:hypothetical protein